MDELVHVVLRARGQGIVEIEGNVAYRSREQAAAVAARSTMLRMVTLRVEDDDQEDAEPVAG